MIGLGNPGRDYAGTRHNLGFAVINMIAHARGVTFSRRCRSFVASICEDTSGIVLARPATYMNNSGRAVKALMDDYAVDADSIFVVCDDMNLPVAKVRVRRNGSSGGHKGLISVAESLGHHDFPRLRIGIGDPGRVDPTHFVLSRFTQKENTLLEEALSAAVDAAMLWAIEGVEEAMNRFN